MFSPEGTAESSFFRMIRPSLRDLDLFLPAYPAINCWAIIECPFGTKLIVETTRSAWYRQVHTQVS